MNTAILLLLLSSNPTYTKDIKPIFKSRCKICHNKYSPDRNWMNYDKAYEKRALIKLRIENKSMPPGDMPITDEERQLIIKWIDTGAKK